MTAKTPFADRCEAGLMLGAKLVADFTLAPETTVLGLVRGGAVVAHHLAAAAGLPWDILLVRKLGAPRQPEYAVGAYTESGNVMVNPHVLDDLGLDEAWLERSRQQAGAECHRLHRELRGDLSVPQLGGSDLILCDDGMATGLTMQAAIQAARAAGANRVIVAVPVLPAEALYLLERLQVEHCYLSCPAGFRAVGQFYHDFAPVASREVRRLLLERQ